MGCAFYTGFMSEVLDFNIKPTLSSKLQNSYNSTKQRTWKSWALSRPLLH